MAIAAAFILLLPTLWSLGSAVWSAATTGQVLVVSIGRYEAARQLVPWPAGWARFVGPILVLASVLVYLGSAPYKSTRFWCAAALSAAGIYLLSFSWWFSSIHRAFSAVVLVIFIVVALALGNRVGRTAAYLFVVCSFGVLVWWTFRAAN